MQRGEYVWIWNCACKLFRLKCIAKLWSGKPNQEEWVAYGLHGEAELWIFCWNLVYKCFDLPWLRKNQKSRNLLIGSSFQKWNSAVIAAVLIDTAGPTFAWGLGFLFLIGWLLVLITPCTTDICTSFLYLLLLHGASDKLYAWALYLFDLYFGAQEVHISLNISNIAIFHKTVCQKV